jgi:hypothetical protein
MFISNFTHNHLGLPCDNKTNFEEIMWISQLHFSISAFKQWDFKVTFFSHPGGGKEWNKIDFISQHK